ncbi:tRNA pseudouridine(55) synthase TruB, partial [Streptococcus thermophilus]|nr:tRNA pseudouridine(55) synthase TruB [Streptococcus thermophilus]
AVYHARKILGIKKIGHSGTLDPNVDGVLPLAIGAGTKAVPQLMASGKVYTGEITLGFATTTEDLDGEVVDKTPLTQPFTADQLDAALTAWTG